MDTSQRGRRASRAACVLAGFSTGIRETVAEEKSHTSGPDGSATRSSSMSEGLPVSRDGGDMF